MTLLGLAAAASMAAHEQGRFWEFPWRTYVETEVAEAQRRQLQR